MKLREKCKHYERATASNDARGKDIKKAKILLSQVIYFYFPRLPRTKYNNRQISGIYAFFLLANLAQHSKFLSLFRVFIKYEANLIDTLIDYCQTSGY